MKGWGGRNHHLAFYKGTCLRIKYTHCSVSDINKKITHKDRLNVKERSTEKNRIITFKTIGKNWTFTGS